MTARPPSFDGTQACYGASLDLFFPKAGPVAQTAVKEAKEVCAGCRFLRPCFEYALWAQGSPGRYVDGVWGGTSTKERQEIRRRQRGAAA